MRGGSSLGGVVLIVLFLRRARRGSEERGRGRGEERERKEGREGGRGGSEGARERERIGESAYLCTCVRAWVLALVCSCRTFLSSQRTPAFMVQTAGTYLHSSNG